MPKQYSITEARIHLAQILNEVNVGHEVEITRRGNPIALVVSCDATERLKKPRAEFSRLYDAFLEKVSLIEHGVDDDFAGSLRSCEPERKPPF